MPSRENAMAAMFKMHKIEINLLDACEQGDNQAVPCPPVVMVSEANHPPKSQLHQSAH
ncbi:MAG: hypothetical protein LLG42_16015 [Chloroflexi bacterium]|nr:hypothetical protein [Chloroflexota bacterium]